MHTASAHYTFAHCTLQLCTAQCMCAHWCRLPLAGVVLWQLLSLKSDIMVCSAVRSVPSKMFSAHYYKVSSPSRRCCTLAASQCTCAHWSKVSSSLAGVALLQLLSLLLTLLLTDNAQFIHCTANVHTALVQGVVLLVLQFGSCCHCCAAIAATWHHKHHQDPQPELCCFPSSYFKKLNIIQFHSS